MPGFLIHNMPTTTSIHNYDDSRCTTGEMTVDSWHISWNVLDKFMGDKIFYSNDAYAIILDGVILNKVELIRQYGQKNWTDTFVYMLETAKDTTQMFSLLRGAFCGAIWDRKNHKWVAFTDQLGSHLICSYSNNGKVAIGTEMHYFSEWMKHNGIHRNVDENWARDMLEYGYMRDGYTVLKGVRRVFPGTFIECAEPEFTITERVYWNVKKRSEQITNIREAMDGLNRTFSNAIHRILEKCREYGYKAIVDISGGLDSRMIAAYAAQQKSDVGLLGLNYSQTGALDQKISLEVANRLGIDLVHFPLNGGRCLMEIEDLVRMNQGMNYYSGITGGKKALESLDRKNYGVELYGLLGDIDEGAMISEEDITKLDWNYPRFRTSKMFDTTKNVAFDHSYCDNEVLWFYIRGMLAGMNTGFIRQNFVEALTPYGDVEFLEFNFSLAYDMRIKEHVHRRWLLERFPQLQNLRYSGTGVAVELKDKHHYARRIMRRLMKLTGIHNGVYSMNPVDFWYKQNAELRNMMDRYYQENLPCIQDNHNIKKKVEQMYSKGNVPEKVVALTTLSAVKQYIIQ